MAKEPIVIDADKFARPYLNRVTMEALDKCSAVGSRTGFEEEGLLVKLEDPCCKRFNKDGKFTVFISLEAVERLYHTVHATEPARATDPPWIEDTSEEVDIREFPGLYLSDATVEDRIEEVTIVEYPRGAPKFEDRGWVVTHKLNNCSQQVFISNTLLDHLNQLR